MGIIGIIFLKYTLAESDNFRMRRIIAWLNPEANADTDSYQFLQGLYAIGSGGFLWKGAWKQYTETACDTRGSERYDPCGYL